MEALTGNFAERTKIKVELKSVAFKNLLPTDAKTAVYRVAQEALNNIERHSGASHVLLQLKSTKAGLEMHITDNGCGFSNLLEAKRKSSRDAPPMRSGLGLRNMQERMEHFGGTLEIKTANTGTHLIAKLPSSIYLTHEKEHEKDAAQANLKEATSA